MWNFYFENFLPVPAKHDSSPVIDLELLFLLHQLEFLHTSLPFLFLAEKYSPYSFVAGLQGFGFFDLYHRSDVKLALNHSWKGGIQLLNISRIIISAYYN